MVRGVVSSEYCYGDGFVSWLLFQFSFNSNKTRKKIKKKKALAEAKGENSQLYNGTSLEQNRYTDTLGL